MPTDYIQQALIYFYSVCGGIAFGFLYDVIRISRRAIKTPGFLVILQDILYWLVVSAAMLLLIYQINDGEIRGFIIVGILAGAILYFILFSKAILFMTVPVVSLIIKLIGKLITIIVFPITLILKIIRKIKKRVPKANK